MRIVSRAWIFILPVVVLAIPVVLIAPWAATILVFIAIGIMWFFRDPQRNPPPVGILSPADGRVSVVRLEDDRLRIGVYMNVNNVHVNRAPIAGSIAEIDHRSGAHRPAFSKDSDRNERVLLRIDGEESIDVELIAGAFARRITPYVDWGDSVERGERIGHIAFGSRADVCLPQTYDQSDLLVSQGDSVRAGETVIAIPPDRHPL